MKVSFKATFKASVKSLGVWGLGFRICSACLGFGEFGSRVTRGKEEGNSESSGG